MTRKQISTSAEITIQVHETDSTEHPPGSEEKIRVLTERYANGEPMWHTEDNRECRETPGYRTNRESFGEGILDDDDDVCDDEGGE